MSALINNNLVNLAVEASNKKDVIQQLAQLINQEHRLVDMNEYIRCVLERERLTSTGIGFGVAIPHGKSEAVIEPTIAFGRFVYDVEWDSLDGIDAKVAFLLAVPAHCKVDTHLRMIAGLSRKLVYPDFRHQLMIAQKPQDIVELVLQV